MNNLTKIGGIILTIAAIIFYVVICVVGFNG